MATQFPPSAPEAAAYPFGWYDYTADKTPEEHSVTGNLKIYRAFYSPELDNRRDIWVYLPPSYETETPRRYPVIYMHDGQNLFDRHASYVDEWEVDESMEKLAAEGLEAIVVGINNLNRMEEYAPFPLIERGAAAGLGEVYMRFIVETLKPAIDAEFRTLPDVANTALAGSSLGGLITLYGFFTHPQVFGMAAAFSPAISWDGGKFFTYLHHAESSAGRLYVDVGTNEGDNIGATEEDQQVVSQWYLSSVERLHTLLRGKGYLDDHNLKLIFDHGAIHHETAWARRFPDAVRFMLNR